MTRVALDAVKSAAVNGDDGALHVDQIILAQTLAFLSLCFWTFRVKDCRWPDKYCATKRAKPEVNSVPATAIAWSAEAKAP